MGEAKRRKHLVEAGFLSPWVMPIIDNVRRYQGRCLACGTIEPAHDGPCSSCGGYEGVYEES